jgi:hypothetical protein
MGLFDNFGKKNKRDQEVTANSAVEVDNKHVEPNSLEIMQAKADLDKLVR